MYGFDPKNAKKRKLPIVTGVTDVDLPNETTILIRVHEAVLNQGVSHSLLSQYQMSECVSQVDTRAKKHGGKQQILLKEDLSIPLVTKKCMMTFKHRLPTKTELEGLEQVTITLDAPWSPKEYSEDLDDVVTPQAGEDEVNADLGNTTIGTSGGVNEEFSNKAFHLDVDKDKVIFVQVADVDKMLDENMGKTNQGSRVRGTQEPSLT